MTAEARIRFYTYNRGTGELRVYELKGMDFSSVLGRIKGLPSKQRQWQPEGTVWWVAEEALEQLYEEGVFTVHEVAPLQLSVMEDRNEGTVSMQPSIFVRPKVFSFEDWGEPFVGDVITAQVQLDDLLQHPERGVRVEISQELRRRLDLLEEALSTQFMQHYHHQMVGTQTHAAVINAVVAAVQETQLHFQRHPFAPERVVFPRLTVDAPAVRGMFLTTVTRATAKTQAAERPVVVLLEDGSVVQHVYGLDLSRIQEACVYNAQSEVVSRQKVLFSEDVYRQILQLHR